MNEKQSNCTAGILLVNLGTPDSPSRGDVKRYLREFLMDPRVVEMPRLLWWPILNGVILNLRPARSAAAYSKIWLEEGSPLLVHTLAQAEALQRKLGEAVRVVPAMRYGKPSIAAGLEKLREAGCERILVFPLYPQYSSTTTASVFDAVTAELRRWRWIPELRLVNQYFEDPGYITALADSVRDFQQEHGKPEKLLLSFHGIPQRYADKGDPYPLQCRRTGELLAQALELQPREWQLTYQSRMGREPWLQPYTSTTLESLAREGVKRVQVLCPGFAADCLETLEEIAMENRDLFLQHGGQSYEYIPCLNERPDHIESLAAIANRYLGGWTV
ncbi:MAG: ferrochelatase [Gammaproteobacteria bacterium]|nr:MAG: ferrochelatase [Gammaproteobacteria bacterium]RTZ74685.1 MAG: ferrochelatase [Gammaproteobacteria bacterium]